MLRSALLAACVLSCVSAAQASTVTSNTFTGADTYDFNASPSGTYNATTLTRSIGVETFTATADVASMLEDFTGSFGINGNGEWNSGRSGYSGLNSARGTVTITFSDLASAVGFFMNYPVSDQGQLLYAGPVLSIYDDSGALLESFDIHAAAPILTGSTSRNDGAFRGFMRAAAEIRSMTISGGYYVFDDMAAVFGEGAEAEVPLPAAGWLLIAGLGGVAALRRKAG